LRLVDAEGETRCPIPPEELAVIPFIGPAEAN
jgi:hypothetical protein